MMAATLTVAAMTLGELLGSAAANHADLRITDLVLDSRQVTPGAAFLALPGTATHGLEFAAEARARGAVIVLYEPDAEHVGVTEPSLAVPGLRGQLGSLGRRFFGRTGVHCELAAVTGTNGKTTIAYSLADAMTRAGRPCGYIGTLGYGPTTKLEAHGLTTPDCLTLHRELAAMRLPHVALEVSSHALEQERIAGLEVGVALFSNLTRDHLDYHQDFAHYAAAKARLFALSSLDVAVINVDDPYGADLLDLLPSGAEPLRVSLDPARDVELSGALTSLGLGGLELEIAGRFGSALLRSALIGSFNAENLMLALGGLLAFDVPLAQAVQALAATPAPPGRMQVLGNTAATPCVVVDYAHTPAALERVLTTLRPFAAGKLWCVFGCGGERDRGKRALMGAAAARLADHVVLTDDNPRREDPAGIVADIRAGVAAGTDLRVEHARDEAIASTLALAAPGDVVLIAGKGHETQQTLGDRRVPLDDAAIVRRLIGGSG